MRCKVCQKDYPILSRSLGCCKDCLINEPEKTQKYKIRAHKKAREPFGLPYPPPQNRNGISCQICLNKCKIGKGEISFCGMRKNEDGKMVILEEVRIRESLSGIMIPCQQTVWLLLSARVLKKLE